eukprot:CAMPEP_0114333156 /NCGR_PEP_ID=MMETSP0101-20121206/3575_1 /TAXON_ID=38822 ORGANISM="Pteridomonas danica, Strain PT" /NCGR_SAMPLE_ID=MMETSP0101 /ASSEMBLY_ACC=CAM_ASM_000211 /LENGTH=242 /DNA_ID=CAMNT_0001464097 /DNA_START=746 /DNA_END=1474 /DNA_ORIENTATION=-
MNDEQDDGHEKKQNDPDNKTIQEIDIKCKDVIEKHLQLSKHQINEDGLKTSIQMEQQNEDKTMDDVSSPPPSSPQTEDSLKPLEPLIEIDDLLHRLRTGTFVGFVVLGVIVAIHWAMLVATEARQAFLPKFFLMICCYGVGFGFYFLHIPERWFPGKFDYIFHSHQIWHVFVVLAVLVWLNTCMDVTSLLNNQGCNAFIHPDMLHVTSNASFVQDIQALMAGDGYGLLQQPVSLRGSSSSRS